MRNPMEVMGAYGRNYSSKEAAEKDWKDGKDFLVVPSGPYLSVRDSALLKDRGHDGVRVWSSLGPVAEIEV